MFDTSGHVERRDAIRLAVITGDQSWRETVNARFAAYMLFRAKYARDTADFHESHIDDAPNPAPLRDLIAALREQANAMDEAAMREAVADPVGSEVMLRIAGW